MERLDNSGKPGQAITREEKSGTVEIPGFQGGVISLGPPRASEPKRYLDALPDILTVEEVALFLNVSSSTISNFLRDGIYMGRSWGEGGRLASLTWKSS